MGKTYACSDMHGMYSFYEQIKTYIQPEDRVICLGDCGDRGPNSLKTIKAVLNDPQFTYLKGNHEHILYNAIKERNGIFCGLNDYIYLNSINGGRKTLMDASKESKPLEFAKTLENLPLWDFYTNKYGKKIALSHAGFTPTLEPEDEEDYLWNRDHIYNCWIDNDQIDIVVHGHTTIPYHFVELENFDGKPHFYCDNHKIDIDAGSAFSKKGILLDLDTFDSITFNLTD